MKRMNVSRSVIEGRFGDDPKLDWTSISQFEGKVKQVPIADAEGMSVSIVHFHDGARTYVHSHKGGQILLILRGTAQIGTVADGMIEELAAGDMVYAAPGELHWHGAAAPGVDMTHLTIAIGPSTWDSPPPKRPA